MRSKKYADMGGLICTKTCPICGKIFYVLDPGAWAYRSYSRKQKRTAYLCSWHCLRAYQKTGD